MTMQLNPTLLQQRDQLINKQRELFLIAVENLATAVALRDTYTGEHSRRVTRFAILLGEQLHLSAAELESLRFGTPLHDIGKIGVVDAILRKPGPLTPAEFEIMKTHPTAGSKIIELIPDLHAILPIVRSHHERWDGTGYPDSLASDAIPLLARIVAVAEAFDAMTSDTPYRKALTLDEAFSELGRHSGSQFDPTIVTAFLQARDRVIELMKAPELDSRAFGRVESKS